MTWLALAGCRLDSESLEEMRGWLDRDEREHCSESPSPDRLLGRIAAKRAVCQALSKAGTEATPQRVTIRPAADRRPVVLVDGMVRDPVLGDSGTRLLCVTVSISHEPAMGVALAGVWPPGPPPLRVGIDVLGKARMRRQRPRGEWDLLVRRVLTPGERRAAVWVTPAGLEHAIAAKEAAGKALRWSTGPLSWHDVEIDFSEGAGLEDAQRLEGVFAGNGWAEAGRARWVTTRRRTMAGAALFADRGEFLVAAAVGAS